MLKEKNLNSWVQKSRGKNRSGFRNPLRKLCSLSAGLESVSLEVLGHRVKKIRIPLSFRLPLPSGEFRVLKAEN